MEKSLRNRKGFTLMELIVAMVILALIIAITAPVLYNQFQIWSAQAGSSKTASQLQDIQTGITQYQMTNGGSSPASIDAMVTANYLMKAPVPASAVSAYAWAAGPPVVVSATTTSSVLCSKVNEQFAGGVAGAAPPAAVNTALNLQCYGAASPFTIQQTMM